MTIQGDTLLLRVGKKVLDQRESHDASALFIVTLENDLYQGEEPFYIVLFDDVAWLVPFFTVGTQNFLKAIKPSVLKKSGVQRVDEFHLPWSWRKRQLGWLPIFPIPRLLACPRNSLPKWSPIELTATELSQIF